MTNVYEVFTVIFKQHNRYIAKRFLYLKHKKSHFRYRTAQKFQTYIAYYSAA
jgi:hypothetical protein